MTIKTKAPRWYQWKDGQITPMYELAKKSGNGNKPYSLREARELKLLPSVTSVLSVIDKPDLDNWRVKTAIEAAMTLPRYPGESEDEYAERVLADAEAQANKAAEFGTRIHDAIANFIMSPDGFIEPELLAYLESFRQWRYDNIEEVHAVEKCVGHPSIGVAGRMDLYCTLKDVGRCIVDFKSQAIKDRKANFWPDWGPQLAAYAMCHKDGHIRRIASVVVPSNEPGPVSVKVYDDREQGKSERIFEHALELWILARDYDPRQT